MEISIENVRSFAGLHRVPLRPLTVLVGENSSGKSTFLAMVAAVLNTNYPAPRTLFNTQPFELGGYDTIATYKGGKYGRAKSFSIGFSVEESGQRRSVKASYTARKGQPELSHYIIQQGEEKIVCRFEGSKVSGEADLYLEEEKDLEEHKAALTVLPFSLELPPETLMPINEALMSIVLYSGMKDTSERKLRSKGIIEKVFSLTSGLGGFSKQKATAIAPIRTKPRRTYDQLTDEFKPEGDHVPLMLAHLPQDSDTATTEHVWDALRAFGSGSGLFSNLHVKMLGPRPSDPFQIRVRTIGPWVNLADVGYGVSQSLPVVVESVLAGKGTILLLQQPEVHLHPRAQAALGSLLVTLTNENRQQFVVETHSDYLVDRIRIDVAAGKISNDLVQILFFDRRRITTRMHVLGVDKKGNITNAPPTFRSFFLKEELRLATRGS